MGLIGDFIRGESRSDFTEAIQKFLTGTDAAPANTSSGVAVDEQGSMALTSVYSCIKILAWTIASLPLQVYKRLDPRGKERASNHPIYRLLHDQPNPEQTAFQWRSLTSVHQNLWGAGISEIERDSGGRPIALWPIPPWKVTPRRNAVTKAVTYEIRLDSGGTRTLTSHEVVVFPAIAWSSFEWMSPIALHRETIGSAKAVKEFGSKTFGQGVNPAGIVTHPGKLTENAHKSLRESFSGYAGLGNSHRLMLLDEGMKWESVGLPPEDAQYLETRRFDVSEIARIYNVPLYMLQDHEKQTSWGSGIEEQKDGFVTFTMVPYFVQWEQELNRRLIDDDQYFCEFLVAGLLRGKLSDRYAAYQVGRQNGWLSANDIRDLENLNPIPGKAGEMYLVPLNMQNAEYAGEKPDVSKAGAPAAGKAKPYPAASDDAKPDAKKGAKDDE